MNFYENVESIFYYFFLPSKKETFSVLCSAVAVLAAHGATMHAQRLFPAAVGQQGVVLEDLDGRAVGFLVAAILGRTPKRRNSPKAFLWLQRRRAHPNSVNLAGGILFQAIPGLPLF